MRHQKTKNPGLNRFRRRVRRTAGGIARRDRNQLRIRKTNMHFYAEITNPTGSVTLVSLSTRHPSVAAQVKKGVARKEAATLLGTELAKLALAKDIKQVAFNRSGHLYHGVVKAFAEAVRAGNIDF